MNTETESRVPRLIQAADWAERMRDARPLDAEESRAFVFWLRASRENVDAYLSLLALQGELERATAQPARRRRHGLGWRIAAGAAVAGVFVAGAAWQWWHAGDWKSFRGAANAESLVALEDGSTMTLYENSSIKVRYSPEARELRLGDGGAQLKVAKDPARPFLVIAPGGTVQATGTEFNVLRKGDETGVFVSVGEVRVQGRAQQRLVLLTAGNSVNLRADGHVQGVKQSDEARLHVPTCTLTELAEAFNSRNRVPQLRVAGTARKVRLGTLFDLNDPKKFVQGLGALGHYDVEREGNLVTIRLKPDRSG